MVYILLGDGFEEMEAVVPADLLRRAGRDVALVGLEEGPVTGGHGITVVPDLTLSQVDPEQIEMLVLPGGMGGVESIQMNLFALALIQQAHEQGRYLAAICAAPTILAHLGILDRR
ncbi:MAG: DJ-1/PfpI family protein, partial [Clostridiales bacterium]|nr:DJ-1/PfpI family protein [Clostridiales bacterium]